MRTKPGSPVPDCMTRIEVVGHSHFDPAGASVPLDPPRVALDPHALGDQQGWGNRVGPDGRRQPQQLVPVAPAARGFQVGDQCLG